MVFSECSFTMQLFLKRTPAALRRGKWHGDNQHEEVLQMTTARKRAGIIHDIAKANMASAMPKN